MKKHLIKPGFELIFSLSLIAIFGIPALVFAQNTKNRNIDIAIANGDTIVNGKNIKDLSPADRKEALKDIQNLSDDNDKLMSGNQRFIIRSRGKSDTGKNIIIERRRFNDGDRGFAFRGDSMHAMKFRYRRPGGKDTMMTYSFRMGRGPHGEFRLEPRDFAFRGDSMHTMKFRYRRPNGKDSMMTFNFRMRPDREENLRYFSFDAPDFNVMRRDFMNRRNSQHFSYSTTGSDGMTTRVNFMVSDVPPERAKQLTGSEKAGLELMDLSLVPEFTSGKTLLMFSMPAHTAADVKFMDHDGKVIWSDKSMNGTFSKSFTLALNGSYLLEVKQGGKTALKRVMKEE